MKSRYIQKTCIGLAAKLFCSSLGNAHTLLEVDPELGAGLDLAADPYGYLVEGVDEKPGQRLKAYC